MYSLSGPINPALPIASKLPERSPTIRQMIGTLACRANAQLSALGAAFSSSVSGWSVEEKYCVFSRRRSFGYWLPGPRPGIDGATPRLLQARDAGITVRWRVRHLRGVDCRRHPGV